MSSVKRLSIGIVVSVVAALTMMGLSPSKVEAVNGGWLANCAKYHNSGGGAVLCYPPGYPNSITSYRAHLQGCIYGVFCKWYYGPVRYNAAVSSVAIPYADYQKGYRAVYIDAVCSSYCG